MLQINCVVVLEEQIRTKDLLYRDLLNRVRQGEGTQKDYSLLQTRIVGIGLQISLKDPPWNEVCCMGQVLSSINREYAFNKILVYERFVKTCFPNNNHADARIKGN